VDFAIHANAGTDRTIEAVFPLVALGKNSPVAAGDSLGFEIEILDNDGAGRDHVLSWNKNEHMAWYNPTKLGTIIFTENTITFLKNTKSSDVLVYTNPVSNNVLIQSSKQFNEVVIYSVQGQLMIDHSGLSNSSIYLDINKFQPGIYILLVKMNDGTWANCKLLMGASD
jgi:hypothetical protein